MSGQETLTARIGAEETASIGATTESPLQSLYDALYADVKEGRVGFYESTETIKKRLLQQALTESNDLITKAAELLGISFRQVRYLTLKYNLKPHSDRKKLSAT